VTLRRRVPLSSKPNRDLLAEYRAFSRAVKERDRYTCVGPAAGLSGACHGALAADHIRASGALSRKSRSTPDNGATLCLSHHDWKTAHGKEARPLLLAYVDGL
jgi:hypothetical protein